MGNCIVTYYNFLPVKYKVLRIYKISDNSKKREIQHHIKILTRPTFRCLQFLNHFRFSDIYLNNLFWVEFRTYKLSSEKLSCLVSKTRCKTVFKMMALCHDSPEPRSAHCLAAILPLNTSGASQSWQKSAGDDRVTPLSAKYRKLGGSPRSGEKLNETDGLVDFRQVP